MGLRSILRFETWFIFRIARRINGKYFPKQVQDRVKNRQIFNKQDKLNNASKINYTKSQRIRLEYIIYLFICISVSLLRQNRYFNRGQLLEWSHVMYKEQYRASIWVIRVVSL